MIEKAREFSSALHNCASKFWEYCQVKIEKILRLCQVARTLHNDDILPKLPKLTHAKIACGLSRNLSVQDIAVYANCSVRTVHRYVKSPTIQAVVDELMKSRLESVSRETSIDDIYEILFDKAKNGDMSAIKEVIMLTAPADKAEDHPSPPPEYLKVLSPAWVDGPASTDEAVELTDQLNS